ncbi:MAG: LacI family DNA-binding transcriptional regulator [Deinococcota bacterium]
MSTKRYTIQDIARQADVGVGTVSRVLNNDVSVKPTTRSKVQAVIQAMDYQPSFMARSLRTQKSNTFGFIADAVTTTPFAVNLVKGAQDAAWEHGKLLLIVDADNNPEMRERALESMLERDVEGIIYAAMFHQEVSLSEAFGTVPTVLVDCYTADNRFTASVPDEVQAGRDATRELLRRGHERVAIILNASLESPYPAAAGRYQGYCEALEEVNLQPMPELVQIGEGNAASAFACTLTLMALPDPPTAIFCCTDRMALGTYDALRSLNLNIPNDVSVIGFDNQAVIAEQLYPPLSTMALPHEAMGRWAIEQLLEHPSPPPTNHVFPCPLISRASIKILKT